MNDTWNKAQEWEASWHGNCVNSLGEELKQLVYAEKMGLKLAPNPKTPYSFNLEGKSILDIGSGAYSLLLKCENKGLCFAVDPLMANFPKWVIDRYIISGIVPMKSAGEELLELAEFSDGQTVDEVWIYNVLEHVYEPRKIIENALSVSKIVRIFEWLDTRSNIGHPQTLIREELDLWLGGEGKVEEIRRGGAVGKCYSGIFKGKHYAE